LADIFTKKKRSEIMRKIGPRNSKQEVFVQSIVHSLGYKYFSHLKELPGKPDLVFPRHKKVIFINGCFWHGHQRCKRAKLPATNFEFWERKIGGNVDKDKRDYKVLKKSGWEYLVIWQCRIKFKNVLTLKKEIKEFLKRH
jgi:DNA mismatch endonuclease (patch repair protein)